MSYGDKKSNPSKMELQLAKIRFIEDWEAGLRPTIEQYINRYPEFAQDLADFIVTFIETENAAASILELESPTELSERALRRASAMERNSTPTPLESLFEIAKASGISFEELTVTLKMSQQFLLKILRGEVLSPPHYLVRMLAQLFKRSEYVIQTCISVPLPSKALLSGHHRVVNTTSLPSNATLKQITFVALLEKSSELTEEQRSFWQGILQEENSAKEGLS